MKKTLLTMCVLFAYIGTLAQTATDANGNKISGPSIAIFTNLNKFIVEGDRVTPNLASDAEKGVVSVFGMAALHAAKANGLIVCNRDEAAMEDIKSFLEEQKGEEYLMGLTVQAKNIGARYILIQDISIYSALKGKYATWSFDYRFLDVENNAARHFFFEKEFVANNEKKAAKEAAEWAKPHLEEVKDMFRQVVPNFLSFVQARGGTALLAPTRVFLANPNDKFYFSKYASLSGQIRGVQNSFNSIEQVAIGTNPEVESGLLKVSLDKSLNTTENIVVSTSPATTMQLQTEFVIPVAVKELPIEDGTLEGYYARMTNNALNYAITDNPSIVLIENANLSAIKKERELQKSEDFLDGQVVDQYKACGAQWIIRLSDFSVNKKKAKLLSFKLSLIDVSTLTTEKEFYITECHLSNLDDALNYYISKCFLLTCTFHKFHTSKPSFLVNYKINATKNDGFTLVYNKPIVNAITGETTYVRAELASLSYTKGNGQLHEMKVVKMLDKEGYKALAENYGDALLYIQPNKVEPKASELAKDKTKEKKALREEKTKKRIQKASKFMQALGQAMQQSSGNRGFNFNKGGFNLNIGR